MNVKPNDVDNVKTWVASAHPEDDHLIRELPEDMVNGLYPSIYSYGPRGEEVEEMIAALLLFAGITGAPKIDALFYKLYSALDFPTPPSQTIFLYAAENWPNLIKRQKESFNDGITEYLREALPEISGRRNFNYPTRETIVVVESILNVIVTALTVKSLAEENEDMVTVADTLIRVWEESPIFLGVANCCKIKPQRVADKEIKTRN